MAVRAQYFGMWMVGLILAFCARWAATGMANWTWLQAFKVPTVQEIQDLCVLRFSFTWVCMHGLLIFLTIGASGDYPQFFVACHRKLWWVKLIAAILFFMISWLFPNDFFYGYGKFADVISIIYWVIAWFTVVMQCYSISNGLFHIGGTAGAVILIIVLLILVALPISFVGVIMGMNANKVNLYPYAVYITIAAVILVLAACFAVKRGSSILAAGGSVFMLGFLVIVMTSNYFGMFPLSGAVIPDWLVQVGAWFSTIVMGMTVMNIVTRDVSFQTLYKRADEVEVADFGFQSDEEDREAADPSYHYFMFHIYMLAASAAWVSVLGVHGKIGDKVGGEIAYYTKFIPICICAVIHIWTIVIPGIFSDNKF